MNKLLNYKTKTKNATPPIFTEIVALFFFTNCQRWEYIIIFFSFQWIGLFELTVKQNNTCQHKQLGKNFL